MKYQLWLYYFASKKRMPLNLHSLIYCFINFNSFYNFKIKYKFKVLRKKKNDDQRSKTNFHHQLILRVNFERMEFLVVLIKLYLTPRMFPVKNLVVGIVFRKPYFDMD